ncbi:unnamed protein product [Caenorhabditis auriculariae]|uniref:Uncharacterized protein n=1 Tax=Caenorhabditis auriculariae TaxID=2777116 RepID=A0A8S1HDU4_9PELO|nr:unnamed protein product [Caenorhabditis auriculariae]
MTMIVVCFPSAPGIIPEKAKAEEDWQKAMQSVIQEVVDGAVAREDYCKEDGLSIEWLMMQLNANPRTPAANSGPVHITRSLLDQFLSSKGIKHD